MHFYLVLKLWIDETVFWIKLNITIVIIVGVVQVSTLITNIVGDIVCRISLDFTRTFAGDFQSIIITNFVSVIFSCTVSMFNFNYDRLTGSGEDLDSFIMRTVGHIQTIHLQQQDR